MKQDFLKSASSCLHGLNVAVAAVVACLALTAASTIAVTRARSVWDGVYSKAQAARGKTIYNETCARCHGETMLGGDDAKPLAGSEFLERWDRKAVWVMFDVTRRTMPDDGPAVLSRAQTVDVVAYVLSANGFPAGAVDLTADDAALKDTLILRKKP